MKKKSKSAVKVDPYIDGLMAKLLERLISLDKKMDIVLSRTSGKSSGGQSQHSPSPTAPQPPRRDRTLYEAVCADCSKVCEVPFQPTESRPVYCKECWARRKGGGNQHRPGMPVLTPVSLPPKPVSKLHLAQQALTPAKAAPKKAKKSKPAKKAKKKK